MKKLCCITTIEQTTETFVIPAMKKFVEEGYDVTLICSMSDAFIEKYSEMFHCINVQMRRGVCFSDLIKKPFEFYRIFKREKYDFVQYATTNASLYASFPAWLARIPHRVCCMWGIGFYTKSGISRFIYKQVEKFPCRFANHISIPSKKNQELGASHRLYKLSHSSVVGDGGTVGVDLNVFNHLNRESYKQQVLSEYPILKDKLVYGFLGRIYRDKGTNELIKAFFNLPNRDECALLLIGPFDASREALDADVLEEVKKYTNIIFHGFTREVSKYLSAVDVMCHPSYHEGFSMAIQQGMAMGCAIVTTDVPGPSEVVEEGVSGFTVPIRDASELNKAMIRIQDERLRADFVKAGLERVRTKFTRERMIQLTYENRLDIINGKYDK